MKNETLALSCLHAHPHNSNVMPDALFEKLVDHIESTHRYPPIVVRQRQEGGYEIIDGHHRVKALGRLGVDTAHCVVWDVNESEALLLLATLNRLEGSDDPRKRAALVAQLQGGRDLKALSQLLPERVEHLKKLVTLNQAMPAPRKPQALEAMPVAVHFFLLPAQRRAMEARLREVGGSREEALMALVGMDL